MHSELSEALEGVRKDKADDHLPHLKSEVVELADLMIRLFDYAGNRELDLNAAILTITTQLGMEKDNKADQIASMHSNLSDALGDENNEAYFLCCVIRRVTNYCGRYHLGLWSAMEEKHAYNQSRADHSFEARAAQGGKKF